MDNVLQTKKKELLSRLIKRRQHRASSRDAAFQLLVKSGLYREDGTLKLDEFTEQLADPASPQLRKVANG